MSEDESARITKEDVDGALRSEVAHFFQIDAKRDAI
jgi:hypothetical protein